MIFWISPVSPVAFLTSSGWRGLSRSVGLMPRTPQGLCTDQRKQWLSGSGDRFPSVEPFLFWVLRSDHCALVLQCDSRRKGVANVKNNIWAIHTIMFYLPEILWAADTTCGSLPHLFLATWLPPPREGLPWPPLLHCNPPMPKPRSYLSWFFSRATVHAHTHTHTPLGCRCREKTDFGTFGHSCISSS